MKKEKANNIKKTIQYVNEDTDQVKKFIIILIGISIIAFLLYFLTAKYLVKDNFNDKNDIKQEENIVYDTVNIGTVFNRPYDTYYVFAYDGKEEKASYYYSIIQGSKKGKIYFLDLSLDINKGCLSEKGNPKANNSTELALTEHTLMKIENSTITKYLEDIDKIEKELK